MKMWMWSEQQRSSSSSSPLRLPLLQFLIQSAQELKVAPIVKYAALSLFFDRFYPSLSRFTHLGDDTANWLLQPIRESNLQLFALISIWVSSKIHDSRPLSVKSLKSLGDKTITEQHFTTRDFVAAVLNFEIGTANNAFVFLEELYFQFKEVAKLGEVLNFEACIDIMDLLYERLLHVITVPKQRQEFPVLPWGFWYDLKFSKHKPPNRSKTEEVTVESLNQLIDALKGTLKSVLRQARYSGSKIGAKCKCYIDSMAGCRFYSKPEVLRYLKSIKRKTSTSKKRKTENGMSSIAVEKHKVEDLPQGWIKEIKIKRMHLELEGTECGISYATV